MIDSKKLQKFRDCAKEALVPDSLIDEYLTDDADLMKIIERFDESKEVFENEKIGVKMQAIVNRRNEIEALYALKNGTSALEFLAGLQGRTNELTARMGSSVMTTRWGLMGKALKQLTTFNEVYNPKFTFDKSFNPLKWGWRHTDLHVKDLVHAMAGEKVDNTIAKKMALEILKVNHEFASIANNLGARIHIRFDYKAPTSHNTNKILTAKYDQWAADVKKWANIDEYFRDREINLEEAYKHVTDHRSLDEVGVHDATLATRMSKNREIVFKDAESEMAYNKKYGSGDIIGDIYDHINKMANDIAHMKRYGRNVDLGRKHIVEFVQRWEENRVREKAISDYDKRQSSWWRTQKMKDKDFVKYDKPGDVGHVNERMYIDDMHLIGVGNQKAAAIGATVRSATISTVLAGILSSQFADAPWAALKMSLDGMGMPSSLTTVLRGTRNLLWNMNKKDAEEMGVYFDTVTSVLSRYDNQLTDNALVPHWLRNTLDVSIRQGLVRWWTEAFQTAVVQGAARRLGKMSNRTFDKLPRRLRRRLSIDGVTPEKWDLMRAGGKDELGRLSPDNIKDKEARDLLMGIYAHQARTAVLEGSTREGSMGRTNPAGTLPGEFGRTIGTFKTFFISMWNVGIKPYLHKPGTKGVTVSDHIENAIYHGIVFPTFGYLSVCLYQLLAGDKPNWPFEDEVSLGKAYLIGMAKTYLGNIFTDYVNSAVSRSGRNFQTTAAGLVPSKLTGAAKSSYKLVEALVTGDGDEKKQAIADAISTIVDNTPFAKLPYTRYPARWATNELLNMYDDTFTDRWLEKKERWSDKGDNQGRLWASEHD